MKNNKVCIALSLQIMCLLLMYGDAFAVQTSKQISSDSRIRTFSYNANTVFVYTGYYRYTSSIEFSSDESIRKITIGDSTRWMIETSGSRMFLKPVEDDATTNMTVYTNKRIYLFELYAENAEDIRDPNLALVTRFTYPDSDSTSGALRFFGDVNQGADDENKPKSDVPDILLEPERYNFNYTTTGSRLIAPLKIFDDGEFTFLEFRSMNADLPAIFMVDELGHESLVNFRISDDYVVVEMVGKQFTLRHGNDVACVFNEADPLKPAQEKKKFLWIF